MFKTLEELIAVIRQRRKFSVEESYTKKLLESINPKLAQIETADAFIPAWVDKKIESQFKKLIIEEETGLLLVIPIIPHINLLFIKEYQLQMTLSFINNDIILIIIYYALILFSRTINVLSWNLICNFHFRIFIIY